ncbi:hypothetical protein ACOME3_005344 [Neoechinorhynchus agilis]
MNDIDHTSGRKLRAVTLNIWGIPVISALRSFRLQAIDKALSELSCDIVALQEVWMLNDFKFFKESLKKCGLRYSHYFHSGLLGSGCCLFSRYKILHSYQHKFTLNGLPHKLHHGDFYAGKMIGFCEIELDCGLFLKCYVTHLHAN